MSGALGSVLVHSFIFKSYTLGTALWYGTRGACRVYDPEMVVGWFRPPSQSHLKTNDLELYNVKTDGFCLLTLAGLLVSFRDAVPEHMTPSIAVQAASIKPYAKALVGWTIFHHVTTMVHAFDHYKRETHYNKSMWIGVWVNAFLTATGGLTLYYIW